MRSLCLIVLTALPATAYGDDDPDGEGDRIEGGWSDTRYCLDIDAGKSNPSCGTFQTHAESIKGERCGDPF